MSRGLVMIAQSNATVALLFVACLIPGTATADLTCLTRPQVYADAALRYEARLRVTGLTCNSFKHYQLFEENNESKYRTLIQVMQQPGKDNDNEDYDDYETTIQNAESQRAASLGALDYCRRNQPMLDEAELDSAHEVDRAITGFTLSDPGTIKPCH